MTIFINPGSGPVKDASKVEADRNMISFLDDLKARGLEAYTEEFIREEDDGRFTYSVNVGGRSIEVEMPGLRLDQVRWMDRPEQNIWHFPRLYVDGSSWVWLYALNMCKPKDAS